MNWEKQSPADMYRKNPGDMSFWTLVNRFYARSNQTIDFVFPINTEPYLREAVIMNRRMRIFGRLDVEI